jgi:ribosome-binding protein aMBF1 (putative translation factor)
MEKSIHSARYAMFLKVLRKARQDAGLSQVQLAHRIGETQTFVSKCERGERRIDVIELHTFCRAFGVSLKQFVSSLERALSRTRPA